MDRGDIFHVDLNPTKGVNKQGPRYVLIVSPPISIKSALRSFVRSRKAETLLEMPGFAVSLSGAGTQAQGVVLCNQARVLDIQSRGGRFVEKVPDFIIDEVLAKLLTLLE